jgi:hypothetical protein
MTPDLTEVENAAQRYGKALESLFDLRHYQNSEALFQLACCLVRADGMQDRDWDPLYESEALINELARLSVQEFDPKIFEHPIRTRMRLNLLAYCHATEAEYFQHLIANLLRIKTGLPYSIDPFFDLWKVLKPKKRDQEKKGNQGPKSRIPPTMNAKIERIRELGTAAGLNVGTLIDEFYFPEIRNSVFHADYVLTDSEFRMRHGMHPQKENYYSAIVTVDAIERIVRTAFAYYSAILTLHDAARRQFMMFDGMAVPYDGHYKGLLEFIFEDGLLSGFRAYWPNGSVSEFTRTKSAGVRGMNTMFAEDHSIGFRVGLYASKPGDFSPLVEVGTEPKYSKSSKGFPIHWPPDHKPYELKA